MKILKVEFGHFRLKIALIDKGSWEKVSSFVDYEKVRATLARLGLRGCI